MSQKSPSPQITDRSFLRETLLEFAKLPRGPWRAEAVAAFRAYHIENLELGGRVGKTGQVPDFGAVLMGKLEAAAAGCGCGIQGFWRLGMHFIPGSGLVPESRAEPFLLVRQGRISPMVVHTEQIVLQCGVFPFVSRYSLDTDLNALFRNALIPESFF
jgi:hypothetical protein